MTVTLRIGVLGLGRLGECLARSLAAAGVKQIAVASRVRADAARVAADIGAHPVDASAIAGAADLLFVAVPDAQVRIACAGLPLTAAHSVVHLSGALGLEALQPAAARGAKTGAWHPLQAFPRAAGSDRFCGISIGIEASDPGLATALEGIARVLGAAPFSLAGVDRAAYHAAAVFASNYVVALHVAAAEVWQRAGLPLATARGALAPLTLGAAQAIAGHELPQALTGPIARGDAGSVASHLQALQEHPIHARLYRALGRELLRLPLALPAELRAALDALLNEPEPGPDSPAQLD